VANFSSDGVGVTKDDAAKVTSLGALFRGNTLITSFDELQYFTGITQMSDLSSYNNGWFRNCTALKSVILPPNVTIIGRGTFENCKALESVGSFANIERIAMRAFAECTSLSIVLDAPRLAIIEDAAFRTSGIVGVDDMGAVVTITGGSSYNSNGAFCKCTNLVYAVIPATTTTIGNNAFYGCTAATAFKVLPTSVPTISGNTFGSVKNAIFYVPDSSVDAYKAASGWSSLASRIKPLSEYQG
jgi:hypothetical protein